MIDWTELGRGLGWLGGILYLIDFIERRIRMYLLDRAAERFRVTGIAQGLSALSPDFVPPKVHTLNCQLCGKNAAQSAFGCEHPAAPKYEHMTVAPVAVTKQDRSKP